MVRVGAPAMAGAGQSLPRRGAVCRARTCLYTPIRSDANTSWRWMAGQKPLYSAATPSSPAMRRIVATMPVDGGAAGAAPPAAGAATRAFWSSWRRTLAVSIGSVAI
jgi:hypothetical protein